jgi:prepilin-type N-terminal cleavage/methylation domain-containing protein
MIKKAHKGFTLAELLIALAILGVIATFTIPKILTSTGTAQFRAVAKEAASIVSGGMQDYMTNYAVTGTSTSANVLSNINYVSSDQTSATTVTGLPVACAAATPCLVLHNGAYLQYRGADTFGGTATTNYLGFNLDPDGIKSNSTTDILTFALYYNGKLLTNRDTITGSTGATPLTLVTVTTTPSWFSWTN